MTLRLSWALVGSSLGFYTGALKTAPVFLTFVEECCNIYSMPFCFSPWTNVDISPTGKISPCCKFKGTVPEYTTLPEYVNSDFLQSIKQQFQQDQWPVGCERCRIEENNNILSKRQLDHQRWKDQYSQYQLASNQFITASVAFGNTCNLKCITCSPHSSSKWSPEYLKIYGVQIQPVKFYKKTFASEFVSQAPDIVHIDIPGGEPFLSGVTEQKELLQQYIQSGQAHNITLHYTTNVTVMPDSEWWDLWQHFKEVELQLSLDGIDKRFEYIRYPGNWVSVFKNVSEYVSQQSKITLSVSHTVSAYNIYYLDEFVSWCYNQGLPSPWLGRVHNPVHMRPTVWPESTRRAIADHLAVSKHPEVQLWSELLNNNDDSKHFDEFCKRIIQHDDYRGLDFKTTFPELTQYI